eukprot:1153967-Pelagomonas_calceolata.AAC.3
MDAHNKVVMPMCPFYVEGQASRLTLADDVCILLCQDTGKLRVSKWCAWAYISIWTYIVSYNKMEKASAVHCSAQV